MSADTQTKQVFRIMIEAPIQTVWNELTKQGAKLPFFFNSVMHTEGLKPGSPIRMRTPNGKYTGVVGDILEVDPPYKFSHTFKFTHLDDPVCMVTYELKEVDGGTEFTLINDALPVGTKTANMMNQGADFITKTLKAMCEKKSYPFMSKFILFMCWITGPLAPKASKTENWPMDRTFEVSS